MLSPADIERALERADAIHRNLPQNGKPLYPRIFESSHYTSPRHSAQPSSSRVDLGDFDTNTAIYSWPLLPNSPRTPLPLSPAFKNGINYPSSSSSVEQSSSASSSPKPMSCHGIGMHMATSGRASYTDRNRNSGRPPSPSSDSFERTRVKYEEYDPYPPIAPLRPATFEGHHRQDDSDIVLDSRSDTDSPPTGRMMLAIEAETPCWSDYVKETKTARGEGGSIWTCYWTTTLNGISNTCTYTGKKQLVRRHIETTHLRKKPYICQYCNERFPQKTSLKVHTSSRHTRDYPWKCPDCDSQYNDPARLHRHRTDRHHYIPRATSRNIGKGSRSSKAQDAFEIIPYAQYHDH